MQILKFKTLDEVIERANNSKNICYLFYLINFKYNKIYNFKANYGLAASVFTKNIDQAIVVSNSLRAGTVWVNCYDNFDVAAPFGGYKQSGFGREKGEYGLSNYLEVKCVTVKIPEKNS